MKSIIEYGIWIPLVLGWVNDWPWLLFLIAWTWAIQAFAHWPLAGIWYLTSLGIALGGEILLAALLPPVPLARSSERVAMEAVALGWSAFNWGALVGFGLWQLGLGFDAASRMHGLLKDLKRRLLLRCLRFALGIVVIVLLFPTP